jgi:ABC-type amino acid transport substrate-binding protein
MIKIFLFLFSSYSFSASFIGYDLQGRFQKDKNFAYNRIMSDFIQTLNGSSTIKYMPILRGSRLFFSEKQHCILPASIEAFKKLRGDIPNFDVKSYVQGDRIEYVVSAIFSRNGEEVVTDFSQLNNKRVSVWYGTPAKSAIKKKTYGVNFIEAKSGLQALNLLKSKRVDYMVGFIPDSPLLANKHNIEKLSYSEASFISRYEVSLICHNTPQGRKLIQKFNIFIKSLKESGKLKQYLGEFSLI